MSNLNTVLEKWYRMKKDLLQLGKEEEILRAKVRNAMNQKGVSTLTSSDYQVKLSQMSRETLSKKDCPPEVWAKYSKKSVFPLVKIAKITDDRRSDEKDILE